MYCIDLLRIDNRFDKRYARIFKIKNMSIEFHFIWGFLIGAGVGALIALFVAQRMVKRVIKKVLNSFG